MDAFFEYNTPLNNIKKPQAAIVSLLKVDVKM